MTCAAKEAAIALCQSKVLKIMQRVLYDAGYQAYLVGGAVRDMLMGKVPHDYDVATDAPPQEVIRLFRRTIPTGIAHGTVTVRLAGESIETTTFRTDGRYTDGRHPDSWEKAASIEDDLSRRDFTMNAVAIELGSKEVVDPFDGAGDIERRIIRAVGEPSKRFNEDGLRAIRAIRFAATTGFKVESATYMAIMEPAILRKAAGVSIERFRDELIKMLGAKKPSVALNMLRETGLLPIFIAEICGKAFDVCDALPRDNITVRLAALFTGVAAPRKVLRALRLPNSIVESVVHLASNSTFCYDDETSDAEVRHFIHRVGQENVDDLIALRRAMNAAEGDALNALKARIQAIENAGCALQLKDLAVTGRDVIASGVPCGPMVGKMLDMLFQRVLDDPAMNTRERLLQLIRDAQLASR